MKWKKDMIAGLGLLAVFAVWTILIRFVDVKAAGPVGTSVGFAYFNVWFHQLTGVHMTLYTITDWLGLVPVTVCVCFGVIGFIQLIKRRKLFRVDTDILLLGVYYVLVILGYLIFEMIPVNYRPVLIDGYLEASYPSSTTLLTLSVMPTFVFQISRRARYPLIRKALSAAAAAFSAFMVIGRLISGVHWVTDIIGSVILSTGLFLLYRSAVSAADKKTNEEYTWNSMKNCRN